MGDTGMLKKVHDSGFGKKEGDTWAEAAGKKLKSLFSSEDEEKESEAAPVKRPRIQPSRLGE